jgi:hypothetical protein
MYGGPEYEITHLGYCDDYEWYTKPYKTINAAVKAWNTMNEDWLDGFDLVWFEVDRVYETRIDCMAVPGGARKVA